MKAIKENLDYKAAEAEHLRNWTLNAFLEVSVPLRILEWDKRGGPAPDQITETCRSVGDLLFNSPEPAAVIVTGDYGKAPVQKTRDEVIRLSNRIAEALAVMAFLPGGVPFAGTRYEGEYAQEEAI